MLLPQPARLRDRLSLRGLRKVFCRLRPRQGRRIRPKSQNYPAEEGTLGSVDPLDLERVSIVLGWKEPGHCIWISFSLFAPKCITLTEPKQCGVACFGRTRLLMHSAASTIAASAGRQFWSWTLMILTIIDVGCVRKCRMCFVALMG